MKAQQVLTLFTKLRSAGVENPAGKNKDTKGNFNNIMDLSLKSSSNSETAAQKSTPVVVTKGSPLKNDNVVVKEEATTAEKGQVNQEEQKGQVSEIISDKKEVDTKTTNQIGIETDEISNLSESNIQCVEGDMLGSADESITEALPETLLTDSDVENQVDDSLLQEDVLKACEDFIGKIKNTVKEQLDITEEELEDLLEKIGAAIIDLLNPDVQKELVLANEGTEDFTVFLTNEELVGKFVQLQEEIHTIVVEAEEMFPELSQREFVSLLQNAIGNLTEEENVIVQEGMHQYEVVEETTRSIKSEENLVASVKKDGQLQDTEQFSHLNLSNNNKNVKENASDILGQEKKETEISVVSLKEETASKGQDFQQSKNGFSKETPKNPILEQFIQNLTVSEQEAVKTFDERLVQQMRNIVEQVVEQIKVVVKPETTSMELQLNPANLGKVNLSVVAKEGTLTASLVVQNEMAKQALESQMQVLRENLNNQGLKVEAVEVSVSDFNFTQSGQTDGGQQQENRKKAPRKINLEMLNGDLDQLSEEDALTAKVMVSNGNQVDYTV